MTDLIAEIAVKTVALALTFVLVVLFLAFTAWLDGPSLTDAEHDVALDLQDAKHAARMAAKEKQP